MLVNQQVTWVLGKKHGVVVKIWKQQAGQLTSARRLSSSIAFGKLYNFSVLYCNHWQKDAVVGKIVEG